MDFLPPRELCISLIFPDKTFDFATTGVSELREWITALRPLIAQPALIETPALYMSKDDKVQHQQLSPRQRQELPSRQQQQQQQQDSHFQKHPNISESSSHFQLHAHSPIMSDKFTLNCHKKIPSVEQVCFGYCYE